MLKSASGKFIPEVLHSTKYLLPESCAALITVNSLPLKKLEFVVSVADASNKPNALIFSLTVRPGSDAPK